MRERLGIQARLEASPNGRLAISLLVITIMLLVVVWNASILGLVEIRRGGPLDTTIRTVGLTQQWSMFAPPPASSPRLIVELEYPDGSVREWHRPGERTGQYRAYHWGKLEEAMVISRRQQLTDGFRVWVMSEDRHGVGAKPIGVRLRESWSLLEPPGPGPLVRHRHLNDLPKGNSGDAPASVTETV